MGVYSDVCLVLEKKLDRKVKENASPDVLRLLEKYADKKMESEISIRRDYFSVKWYEEFEQYDVGQLHKLLERLDPGGENYHIIKITAEYMYDGYSPLDTFGCYSDYDLEPSVIVSFE